MTAINEENVPIPMTIFVAMLDSNYGMGYKGHLPWPYLKEDRDYYIDKCNETSDSSKKNGVLMGRITWGGPDEIKKVRPKWKYVVTSRTLQSRKCTVKSSYHESVEELINGVKCGELEKIFILGGRQNYAMAIEDPRLQTIHVTRIFNDFPVDQYFPEFRHHFHKVSTSDLKRDNDITYQFEVWKRKST